MRFLAIGFLIVGITYLIFALLTISTTVSGMSDTDTLEGILRYLLGAEFICIGLYVWIRYRCVDLHSLIRH